MNYKGLECNGNYNFCIAHVNIQGHSGILNLEFQSLRNLKNVCHSKKYINYNVVNLIELYNFDIKFVFIQLHMRHKLPLDLVNHQHHVHSYHKNP